MEPKMVEIVTVINLATGMAAWFKNSLMVAEWLARNEYSNGDGTLRYYPSLHHYRELSALSAEKLISE
uniref:Uncharacterized protein n=1 Tax=Romanomermis culicivorax TaxID=13658 RepID=A0A915J2U9_ROMCU